jgi:preprotein translocase subunit YajC
MFGTILTSAATSTGSYSSIFFLVIIFVVFYFFLIRPENKKKKQLQEMRKALTMGDEIVTIGGIMGKIVQVTEETITFETGEDRVRIQIAKWAISSNVREDAKAQTQQRGGGLFGRKKEDKSDGPDIT